jgi:hypothetical protein
MAPIFIETNNRNTASSLAPWAIGIIEVAGGYLAFQSVEDYRFWKNKK